MGPRKKGRLVRRAANITPDGTTKEENWCDVQLISLLMGPRKKRRLVRRAANITPDGTTKEEKVGATCS